VIFALHPLNLTTVTPLAAIKFVPLILTLVPTGPLVGVKAVIVGVGLPRKIVRAGRRAPGVVTLSGPVVAPPAPSPESLSLKSP